jgi:hypothetical protein
MVGAQVARVIDSRCPDYPVGTQVVGVFGWRDLTVYRVPEREMESYFSMYEIPDLRGLPVTHAIGACGLTGLVKIKEIIKNFVIIKILFNFLGFPGISLFTKFSIQLHTRLWSYPRLQVPLEVLLGRWQ